jgi:hypothetical protein
MRGECSIHATGFGLNRAPPEASAGRSASSEILLRRAASDQTETPFRAKSGADSDPAADGTDEGITDERRAARQKAPSTGVSGSIMNHKNSQIVDYGI